MEAWFPVILLLQILHTQTGPGLVSMPALINRSLIVAAEILPSLVELVKNPCQQKRRFLCLVYYKKGDVDGEDDFRIPACWGWE